MNGGIETVQHLLSFHPKHDKLPSASALSVVTEEFSISQSQLRTLNVERDRPISKIEATEVGQSIDPEVLW